MKKFILFLLLTLPSIIYAQQKVIKSETVVVIIGKKYYVHTVKKGETLYSISKVYDIPQKQIMLINQEEVINLQADDILKIPFSPDSDLSDKEYSVTFVNHEVQKKQTLYSIASEYGITQDDIYEYNPLSKEGISKGDILKIPVKTKKDITASDEYFIYHIVKSGETISSLAAKYNISEAQIRLVNPSLTGEIKPDQVINIPKKEFTESEFLQFDSNGSLIPNLLGFDVLYFEDPSCEPCSKFNYTNNKTFKVAYILPLFIEDNYENSSELVNDPENGSFYSNTERFLEFYEGSLIAINNLRERGLNIDIYVYDSKKDSITVAKILAKPELKQMDLIIGPLYSENVLQVAEFGKNNRINIVSPISQKNDILTDNPFVFQVVPSKSMLVSKEAEFFKNMLDSNLIVVHNGTAEEIELMNTFNKKLADALLLENDSDNMLFTEVNYKSGGLAAVKSTTKKGENNIVIMFSTEEIFVSKILNSLNAIRVEDKKIISVYGMPAWELFDNMKFEYLKNLQIHYPASSFIDYSDWQVKRFIGSYRDTYNFEPTVYSFQGYDISYYFLSALKRYGKFFQFCLSPTDLEPNKDGLFLDFEFERINEYGGFENNGVFILNYDTELNLKKME